MRSVHPQYNSPDAPCVNTYTQHTRAHAHSFAMHRLSPLAERGPPPRVVICRACNDREGRDSLEAAWDMPFLIRPRCKPERSCTPSFPRRSSLFLFSVSFPSPPRILKPFENLLRTDSIDSLAYLAIRGYERGAADRQRRIDRSRHSNYRRLQIAGESIIIRFSLTSTWLLAGNCKGVMNTSLAAEQLVKAAIRTDRRSRVRSVRIFLAVISTHS